MALGGTGGAADAVPAGAAAQQNHHVTGGGAFPADDAREECAENALHADQLHEARAEEDQDEDKHVLDHALVVAAEEPAAQGRERIYNKESEQDYLSHQLRALKNARLVKARREGKTVFYSLADDHVKTIIDQGLEHVAE